MALGPGDWGTLVWGDKEGLTASFVQPMKRLVFITKSEVRALPRHPSMLNDEYHTQSVEFATDGSLTLSHSRHWSIARPL